MAMPKSASRPIPSATLSKADKRMASFTCAARQGRVGWQNTRKAGHIRHDRRRAAAWRGGDAVRPRLRQDWTVPFAVGSNKDIPG